MRSVLVVEHERACPPALFGAGLSSSSVLVEVVRPYLGDRLPENLDAHAGLVVLGGEMAAWEDEVAPWLPATRKLLADAVNGAVPTLGICLGAQLLALACGGTVERGDRGLEVGQTSVFPLPEADADPYFGAVGDRLGDAAPGDGWNVRSFHHDAVTVLPADAELLVTGNVYPNQGFRVGESGWAVQYHPEVSAEGFAAWAARANQRGGLPQAEQIMQVVRPAEAAQELIARAHVAAFADLL